MCGSFGSEDGSCTDLNSFSDVTISDYGSFLAATRCRMISVGAALSLRTLLPCRCWMGNLAAFPRQEVPLITCIGSTVDQSAEPLKVLTHFLVKVDSAGLLGDDARKMLRFQRIAWSLRGYMHCVRLQVCAQAQGLAHLLRGSSREVDFMWR